MKVYVSELPKSCEKCEFYECQTDIVGEWGIKKHRHICKINGSLIQGICPLQSLSDHDKKVKKEVCDRLTQIIDDNYWKQDTKGTKLIEMSIKPSDLYEILDQIGEEE